eukprot:7438800-Prorocentrum_lima.AAC.1
MEGDASGSGITFKLQDDAAVVPPQLIATKWSTSECAHEKTQGADVVDESGGDAYGPSDTAT